MNKIKYALGIDVGISSVGWGLLELDENNNPFRIIKAGSRIFTAAEVPKTGESKAKVRRGYRGVRRLEQRREYRLDRVRWLLNKYGILNYQYKSSVPSEQADELQKYFNDEINNYYKNKDTNPYKLKVKGLDEKLSNIELAIILVHYAKHRGYMTSREEENDNESGKMLSAINTNKKAMEENNYRTVTEMLLKDSRFKDKIRNEEQVYKMTVYRSMYVDEIKKVLNKQKEYGLIDDNFINDYLKIYTSQRNYANGPGGDSPYGGNLIERMTGKCIYDGEPRAPKCAPSSELFVAISTLVNLRYKARYDADYQKLSEEEIKKVITLALTQDKVTYNDLLKLLYFKEAIFKNLSFTRNEITKLAKDTKKKYGIDEKTRFNINLLNDEQKEEYETEYNKRLFGKTLVELKTYTKFRKKISKDNKQVWNEIADDFDLLDKFATLLTNYKLNDDIAKAIENDPTIDNKYIEIVIGLDNCKDHLMLSLPIIKKLNRIMINGVRYDEAKEILGLKEKNEQFEKSDLLVPLNSERDITNQRVDRALAETRKQINAIIKKYGTPYRINIETARELTKSPDERKELENRAKDNFESNQKLKEQLVSQFSNIFKSTNDVKGMDLLKYKLWKEQNELCAYSGRKITMNDLFNNNFVQVDHILPYSRTFDDSYFNKTLVLTEENQNKGNRTPYEYFGNDSEKWKNFENRIANLNITSKKKDNYLLKKLTPELEQEFRNQNLNDTKYISIKLSSMIKAYLNVTEVNMYPGAVTGKLRARWHLNGLTFDEGQGSFLVKEVDNYDDVKKNRENYLHHALDALVIASIDKSLARKVARYEQYSRYINRKTRAEINYELKSNKIMEEAGTYFNNETGEVIDDLKKYIQENIQELNDSKNYVEYPEPFEDFSDIAKVWVYERDDDYLRNYMRNTHQYNEEEIRNIHKIYPFVVKPKISGRLHEETLYGIKELGDKKYKTTRKSVISKKFKKDDIDNIYQKNSGSSEVVETLKKWMNGHDDGDEAYKAHGHYPKSEKSGNIIKKITIATPYDGQGHIIRGAVADKENIMKINIYKSKDSADDKLYAVGLDLLDIKLYKANKPNNYKLYYGANIKNIILSKSELLNNYNLLVELRKGDLIELTTNNKSQLVIILGFTNGQLEVKSIIGDNTELVGENKLFVKQIVHYKATISTIQNIKKVNISSLGDISGL